MQTKKVLGGKKHVLKKMKPSFSFILNSLNELPGKYESFSCCLQEAKEITLQADKQEENMF